MLYLNYSFKSEIFKDVFSNPSAIFESCLSTFLSKVVWSISNSLFLDRSSLFSSMSSSLILRALLTSSSSAIDLSSVFLFSFSYWEHNVSLKLRLMSCTYFFLCILILVLMFVVALLARCIKSPCDRASCKDYCTRVFFDQVTMLTELVPH